MDVRQLEMFRAVVEEGTFLRAAERLHVSQSAISRQLQLLEEELGTRLLHRGGRGVTLTPDGEVLLSTAKRVDSELQDAVSRIAGARALQHGLISLGGGMTVALYIFPKLLKRFRSRYQNVDVHITTGETEMLLRMLRTRQMDLALLTLPIVAADLEVRPVLKEEMVVVTAKSHPLTRERTIDAPKLGRYPLILFESGSNTRKVLDDFFREEEIPANVVMQTENVEIIKAMVANGIGVTILPWSAIGSDMRHGRFAWSRVRARRLYRQTGWVHLKSEFIPRAVTEVLRTFDEMKSQFGGTAPGR
jgi:DNA-binding transcriptional LysR family regulator